jgi:ADP-heptose:LPS heptosyltransferase
LIIARTCFGVIESLILLADFGNGEPSLQISETWTQADRAYQMQMPELQSARSAKQKNPKPRLQIAICHETSRNATPVDAAGAARFSVTVTTQKTCCYRCDDLAQTLFNLPAKV